MGGSHGGEDYSGGNAHSSGGYFGGEESADPAKGLREYEYSLSAKTKEDIIRRLARALKRAGISVDPDGDLDEIVRELVKQIPNPKKGKTFSNDAESQEKICRVIANVLNDEFTPGITKASEKFIDTSIGPVEMCHQVGEWGHSFAAGVNTEFLAVHASVKNTLRSVEILAEIMKEIYGKIRVKVESADDPALGREFDPLNEIYVRAQNERQRQEELLKNILNVQLAPAAKELEIAMRDESDQNAIIKRLGLKPGTSEFADSLAMAISGLGTAASIAHRVHKALKQVGINVREYLDSEEFSDFQRLLDDKIESGSVKANDLSKFLEAVNTLHASFSHKDDRRFREALSENNTTGGRRHHGGADDDAKTSVQKRVEKYETEKKLILRDFAGRMSRHYDELLAAVKAMGPKLGREIPLSDKTDALNDALKRLREMRMVSQRIELALIGLFMEAEARESKEQFVSTLRVVSSACSAIMELEMYRDSSSHFARLKAAIDGIEKTIDYFADVVTKKYGGNPTLSEEVHGGANEDYLPDIARSGLSFGDAVSEFAYNYYVAKVRSNLDQTSVELDSYGEKYVELLGDAVASRIYTLGVDRKAITDALAAATPRPPPFVIIPPFDNNNAGKARHAAAQKWVNDEYDVKIKLYKALQAVDLYMKAFTAAIVKDPDSIRDIKQMLDGTQVIARWFSEQTGDNIWRAFECMESLNFGRDPPDTGAAGPVKIRASIGRNIPEQTEPHYYNDVSVAGGAANGINKSAFGIPVCGVDCGADTTIPNNVDFAAKAKKAASDAIDYFQALKNLINAFSRIGEKFGGRELRTQVFMSPTQIFKALTDYMKQSALSIHSGPPAGAPVPLDLAAIQLNTGADVIPLTPSVVTPWQVFFGSVDGPGLAGNYAIEDQYFTLIIKAMAAKVLTTVGVYDMFERATPLYDLTPTRMIIGGAEDFTNLEIIEGAAELYFRLPRLAEFYRVFLRWDGSGNDLWRIAMLPELEGIFSGLIRFIFQKAVSPETGDYSDTEMYTIVREVNTIYEHFHEKQPGRASQAALSAFVMEVNRRYGVVKQKDMQDYMAMIKITRDGKYGVVNDTNYAILPGENEPEIDRRAPSDRYSVPGAMAAATPFANRVGLDYAGGPPMGQGRKLMLRDFRIKFEKQFDLITDKSQFGKTSYSLLIKQAEREIRRAKTRDEKFPIVAKLIQGTNLVGTDVNKSVMFHETVVVGLNLLSTFESMLRNFSRIVDRMDPVIIEDTIMDAMYMNTVGAGAVARAPPGAATRAALQTIMVTRFPTCADPDAIAPGTIYDRYLVNHARPNFAMRGNVELAALPVDVYTFLLAEEADFHGIGGGLVGLAPVATLRPSKITEEDPSNNPDVIAAIAAAAAIPGADVAIPRYIRALRLSARLLTDYDKSMRDYVENVFDLMSGTKGADTSQALIEVRMSMSATTGIQLNFSKFRDTVEKLLSDVKYFFDLFRPFLTAKTVKRFEDIKEIGSVFWIERSLIDTFFRGKDNDPNNNDTLEGLARRASKVYANLTRKTNVPLGALITHAGLTSAAGPADPARLAVIPAVVNANEPTRYELYGQTFSELVFYNAVDVNSRQPGVDALTPGIADRNPLGGLILIARPAGGPGTPPTAAGAGAMFRYPIYDTQAQGMTRSRSLLFAYNQLIARYLASLTDTAGGQRIYLNLINSFANGVASRSVTTPAGSAYPDLATANLFGLRGDPVPGAVLFQSLAWIIQRLLKDVSPTNQMPDHIVSTLTDVPMYMKEAMRADLPAFIKHFDLLAQKGDFIKQLMQRTIIKLDRPSQRGVARVIPGGPLPAAATYIRTLSAPAGVLANIELANNIFGLNSMLALYPLDNGQTDVNMKTRIAGIIDAIAAGAFALSSAAAETLKELGDTPLYLQTQEGSIEQYKMRYDRLPLMPISLSLYVLNDLTAATGGAPGTWNDLTLFPGHVLGTPEFKLMYGTRQLIMRSSPVTFEQVPGAKAMLDSHNGVSGSRDRIDETRYLSFIQKTVSALRYITEARNIKSAMSTVNTLFSVRSLIYNGNAAQPERGNGIVSYAPGNPPVEGNAVLAVSVPTPDLQVVLNVVESSNQDEELSLIANRVDGTTSNSNARELERILNLVDMNVIPINYHALMRDIPLANLYNYEYTFEQMVASMYGEQTRLYTETAGPNAINDPTTRNSRQMFLRLLVNPYLAVSTEMYGSETSDTGSAGFVHRIFRGDNNLGMGRPKFLSDQLFNKALFGSVYQSKRDFDEAGPSVGIGASRGQAVSSGPIQNMGALLSGFSVSLSDDLIAFHNQSGGADLAAIPGNAGAVYDWIYARDASGTSPRERIINMATKINRLTGVLTRMPALLPIPPFTAADNLVYVPTLAQEVALLNAAVTEFQGTALRATDHLALIREIDGLGALPLGGAAHKVAVTAAPAFIVAVDRLFHVGFDPANAGSGAELIGQVLGNEFNILIRMETMIARRNPGTTPPSRRQQSGNRASTITYLKSPADINDNAVVEVNLPNFEHKQRLEAIGKTRFDTRFVRNIFFITNVVRILRLKLNRELTQSRNVLVSSHMSVAAGVTEYGSDPFGPNEVNSSNMVTNIARFNDRDLY